MTAFTGSRRTRTLLVAAGIVAVMIAALVTYAAVIPTGENLLVGSKVSPFTLTVHSSASLPPEVQAQEAATAANLFDRDTNTLHVAFAESQVEATFEATHEVRAVKVHGPAPYLLTVKADAGGSYQTIAGLENLNLTLLPSGWTAFDATAPVTTGKLMFVLTPATGGTASGLHELEVWSTRAPVSVKSGAVLLEKMLGPTPPPQGRLYTALNPTANPTVGVVTPSGDDTSDNTFSFTLDRAPSQFVRAYLTYELFGQEHWISPRRDINDITSTAGGAVLLPTTTWSTQVERINPAWLKNGTNLIKFSVLSSSFKDAGYTVRNVRVLAELDTGANAIETISLNQPDEVGTNPIEALNDGDLATGWKPYPSDQPINAAAPSVEFALRRPTQMDAVAFYLSAPLDGELQVSTKRAGQWSDFPPEQGSALSTGWNTIPVRPETPLAERALEGVKLTFRGGFAGNAEIREFLFLGSGVGGRTVPPKIFVTYPDSGQFHGRKAYVQAFVEPWDNGSGTATITLGGKSVLQFAGTVANLVNKDDVGFATQADNDAWSAELKAVYPDGETVTTTLSFTKQMSQASAAEGTLAGAASGTFFPKRKASLAHDESKLVAEAGTVATDTTVTVTPLADESVPALDVGMTNVTKGPRRGYRYLPHGAKFLKNITVTLPYDKALIPPGHTEDDVKTFYFDDQAGRWIALEGTTVDKSNKLVNSLTDHFTDMINAVVTVPDHPQTVSFNPTSMKDIKAADPGAQVNLIEPPKVNNMGDARLSYPIEVPPGRQGMQPQLAVQYNSSGGNGWMGMGWDLSTEAISIDTRWGVPRYDTGQIDGTPRETETYMLNGEQLTPVAHRGDLQSRTAEKVFHTRVEGQFRKIVRHGNTPTTYWWEVTDKNGVRRIYGGDLAANSLDANGVLADPSNGNVFKWMLREIRDLNGNTVRYHYDVVNGGDGATSERWRQVYLRKITYTGTNGGDGPYEVVFNRAGGRGDVTVDARGGFKTVLDQRLTGIDVLLTTEPNPLIRRYVFQYVSGQFSKTLLTTAAQLSDDGITEFNHHRFEYYDEVKTANQNVLAGFNPASFSISGASTVRGEGLLQGTSSTAFGGNSSKNDQKHLYLGITPAIVTYRHGVPIVKPPKLSSAKETSFGFKGGQDSGDSRTLITLIDVDGDGLSDQLYKRGGDIVYRRNLGGPAENVAFDSSEIVVAGLSSLGEDRQTTRTFGAELFISGVSGFKDQSLTRSNGRAYYADVNGDGLVDLVDGGAVYFNRLVNGKPSFESGSPTPIGPGAVTNTAGLITDPNESRADIEATYHLVDPLRRWLAPYAGTVSITGSVRLATTPAPDYTTADGVRVAIQHNGSEIWSTEISATDTAAKTISGLNAVAVNRGDRLYFRVNSKNDGSYDEVEFNPTITYNGVDTAVIDENGKPLYVYNPTSDYAYNGRPIVWMAPLTGTAVLSGTFVKSNATTDDVTLEILKNDAVIKSETIARGTTGAIPIGITLNTVNDVNGTEAVRDEIIARLRTDSRIDLTGVRFDGTLVYTAVSGTTDINDENGNPLFKFDLPGTAESFPVSTATTPYAPWIAPRTGTVRVTQTVTTNSGIPNTFDADVALTIKRSGVRLAKQMIEVTGGAVVGPGALTADLAVTQGDVLYFAAAVQRSDALTHLTIDAPQYIYLPDDGQAPAALPFEIHLGPPDSETFAGGYRNWYFGQYNGNALAQPIDESKLAPSATPDDPRTDFFWPMLPLASLDRWRATDDECWISATRMSASRLHINYLDFSDGSGLGGASAIVRAGGGRNKAAGISVLAFGGGKSEGRNWSDVDFFDFNGDRYPDVVGGGAVQSSLPHGGLAAVAVGTGGPDRVRQAFSENINVSLGATTSRCDADSKGKNCTARTEMAAFNLSGGVTGGRGDVRAEWDMLDINGDGLPDYVRADGSGLRVRLNLGYRFAVEEPWGGSEVRVEKSTNVGINGGFTTPAYSFGGGIAHTIAKTATVQELTDVNGDGLVDIVSKTVSDGLDAPGGALVVRINTGNGFLGAVDFTGSLPHPIRMNASVSRNVGAHFTMIVACIPVPPICFVVNPGYYRGASLGGFEVQLSDFNGDGYADHIYSDTNGNVEVRLNNHGRTNLLKKVYRPLGADFSLRYARSGNTQDQPQSRWVLSGVLAFDGHAGEGADFQASTFAYANGKYDRAERDFYGYRTATEVHRQTAGITLGNAGTVDLEAQPLYRRIVRTFLTSGFYTKGLLETEATFSTANVKLRETINTYQVVDVADGAAVAGLADFSATRFPQLTRTDKFFAEEGSAGQKLTYTTHEYDSLGNLTRFTDAGDDPAADDVDASIGYTTNCASTTYVLKPNQITVNGNGLEMRRREASVNCTTGNVDEVRQYLANGQAAVTELFYESNGNLKTVRGPANTAGSRYQLDYLYDDIVATHVKQVADSFGLRSQATYNFKHAKPETTTDTNTHQTTYGYDEVGRVKSIRGPYEQGPGQSTATLSFAYAPIETPASDALGATVPLAVVPWALTQHVDKDAAGNYKASGTIDTLLFTDGLKRVLQTKKDATVLEDGTASALDKMIVSGQVAFDAFGRTTQQRYPTTEPKGTNTAFNPVPDGVAPTVTDYDALDRVVKTQLPDTTHTGIEYRLGSGRAGVGTQFQTTVTDNNKTAGLNGAVKHTFRDVRELITSVKEDTLNGPIWTSYEYDALKQITQVTDDKNNVTTVTYDNLGRRISINNPDTGLTTFAYDLASNLTQKITANLQAAGQAINYDYDINRLVAVRYPTFTGNNVSYTYGAPGAPNNTAGRIAKVVSRTTTNANGQTFQDSEERHYGKLGEVVYEKKTVVTFTNPSSPSVFETSYQFDTFGRLQKLTYPDGEVLTNAYDSGGNLLATQGIKNGYRYDYLKRLSYDEFEQRVLMESGNNVKTAYTYNAQTRRLSSLTAGKGGGNLFQNLQYSYDNVGNILNLKNTVDVPPASSYGGPTNQTFAYDELYRLTHAQGTFQYSPQKTHTYTLDLGYDTIHNIQTKNQLHTLVQPSLQAITQKKTTYNWVYAYNSSGPSSVRPHAPNHIGDRTYTYDANGNQTGWTHDQNGTRRTIVWNEENRIEEVSDNGHTKTYKYDDQGNRTIKRGPQGETIYVNQFFTQRPGANGTKHIYAGTGRITSKLVKQDTPGANPLGKTPFEKDLYFYHPDHLGTSNYITDTNGKLYEHLEYFPFGESWVEENSNTQRTPYLFTAKELDEETGLYYYGARYYDPRTSVWQSADPILEKYLPTGDRERDRSLPGMGGVFNSSNLGLYSYAHLNPIRYKDPDGNYVEAGFEALSLTLGVFSLKENISQGNYLAATADAFGLAGDAVLAIIPGAPGVIGLGIKASREAGEAVSKTVTREIAERILNKGRPNAQNQELQKIYRQLWRDQDKLPGGTAGELLREAASGGELKHLTKAKERLNQLRSLLSDRNVNMSRLDRKTAEGVMNDLRAAIKAAEETAK